MASSVVARERNQHCRIPQKHSIGKDDTTDELCGKHSAGSHFGASKETDDSNDVPMHESPSSDGQLPSSGGPRGRSNSKAKSTTTDAGGVRQRSKFDGEASGMTPEPKRCKESARQGEVRESHAPPRESPEKKRVRFSTEPGSGGACAITVEEQVEDYWSDEHGQGELFEGLQRGHGSHRGCVRSSAGKWSCARHSRGDGAVVKHLTIRWEKCWRKRNNEREFKARFAERE